jgi:hypothetical protein
MPKKKQAAKVSVFSRLPTPRCLMISKKTKAKQDRDTEREAILDERESLKRLFPSNYSPDIGVFADGKVEVMFKLTISQAQALASLLKEHKL